MRNRTHTGYFLAAAALFGGLAALSAAPVAAAQGNSADQGRLIEDGGWHYLLRLYAWLPSVSGKTRFDLPDGGGSATVDSEDILDNLQGAFMGSAQVRKGRWTGFTDVIYVSLGNDKQGGISLPPEFGSDIDVRVDEDLKGWSWTLGGGYTLWYNDRANVDLLFGARLLDMETDVDLTATGPRDQPLPANLNASVNLWDAVVGVYGRAGVGGNWFIPYYLDVGTGDTDFTSAGYTGVGYAFDWGDLTLTYRYLYYDAGDDEAIQDLTFNGFSAGVAFQF